MQRTCSPSGSSRINDKTFNLFFTVSIARYLEALLIKNNNGTGFFVGKDITLADIYAFHIIEIFKETYPEVLQHCPTIAQLLDRVSKFPGISEWLAVRP